MKTAFSISLALPGEEDTPDHWFAHNSPITKLYLALQSYKRNGRNYTSTTIEWAISALRSGNFLLAVAPDLAPGNEQVSQQISTLLDTAKDAFGTAWEGRLLMDRAEQLRILLDAFLSELAQPGRCRWYGGASAPRDGAGFYARLGTGKGDLEICLALLEPMLRLAGAHPVDKGLLQRTADLRRMMPSLIRTGVLQSPRTFGQVGSAKERQALAASLLVERAGDCVAECLAAAFIASDTGFVERQGRLMETIWEAHRRLSEQLAAPENLANADFKKARDRWLLTGTAISQAPAA